MSVAHQTRFFITVVGTVLAVGCASSKRTITTAYPSDFQLVSEAVDQCADSVGALCADKGSNTDAWSVEVLGSPDDKTWLVRSAVEKALLSRQLKVDDELEAPSDSLVQRLIVRILDIGVRYQEVDRRGLSRTPWINRIGSCAIGVRLVSSSNSVLESGNVHARASDWAPGARVAGLSDPSFSPTAGTVPTSSGIAGPLTVAAAAGALLALFFTTSE